MLSFHSGKTPYISLCSGYEGIGLGLHRVVPNLRAIAYCEREAFAAGNLVAKVEAGLLDSAPVYTDVATFPYREFYPIMGSGIISAGFPCQPFSCAGKRQSTEDERWLFDILCDGFSLMQPGVIFCENVDGLLSAKMPDGSLVIAYIVKRLESLDYRVEVGVFSAAEVGAPHQRKRVFILAVRGDVANGNGQRGCCGYTPREDAADAGQPSTVLWPARPGERQHCWEPPRVTGGVGLADASGSDEPRQARGFGEGEAGRGAAAQSGCQTQPSLGGDLDGSADRLDDALLYESCDSRVDELRLLGNGVVPETAARAFSVLWGRFFGRGLGHAHGA